MNVMLLQHFQSTTGTAVSLQTVPNGLLQVRLNARRHIAFILLTVDQRTAHRK